MAIDYGLVTGRGEGYNALSAFKRFFRRKK